MRKCLLMGRSGSGKSSMRTIIFASYMARETQRLSATMGIEHSHVGLLGGLVLNLWDCGGQSRFIESYLETQQKQVFSSVKVLIFTFDMSEMVEADLQLYENYLDALSQHSPDAGVFALFHKMDLIDSNEREAVIERSRQMVLERSRGRQVTCFGTSIWDETLYKAWSAIVYSLIPQISLLEQQLQDFARISEAAEVVLFEKSTFLVVSHVTRVEYPEQHRFERVSQLMKAFKLGCSRFKAMPHSLFLTNSLFSALLQEFTTDTLLLVVTGRDVRAPVTRMNVDKARPYFEHFIPRSWDEQG